MSVYASTPAYAERRRHPKALLLIVGGHAALIGAVMTAKMTAPIIRDGTTTIFDVPILPDPEPIPEPKPVEKQQQPTDSHVDTPKRQVPVPTFDQRIADPAKDAPINLGPMIGTNPEVTPIIPEPVTAVIRTGPRFATPSGLVEPPYPDDKRRAEEETTLRLKLSIDERGRVIAVEPLGWADRSFLEAARRHLLAKWRYTPATEDGRAVASSTVITLTFRLE